VALDAIGSALTGVSSAFTKQRTVAHNVANQLTEDFRPQRVIQSEARTGGSRVEIERAATPQPVDLAAEFVGSEVASVQAKSSLRVIDTELELLGNLIDTLG